MVNKCSVTGCKSLYSRDNVKVRLHRFPLSNPETLPVWIAATGREKEWKPCKSSRLCGNHFQKSEYIIGHGKNVLKSTSIPTIEYRIGIMKYNKKKSLNSCNDVEQTNKFLEFKTEDSSDANVEIVQLDYNDMYDLKYEHQNEGKNYDHGESYYTNEYEKSENEIYTNNNKPLQSSNLENSYDETSHDETIKSEYEDFNYGLKNDICNRENQCYMFTSSFKEGAEPIILTPPEDDKPSDGPINMDVQKSTTNSNSKKVMVLKLKKESTNKDYCSLYYKTLKKMKHQKKEMYTNSYNKDVESFVTFIETQMKDLIPFRKVYLSAKHKIQHILMRAQRSVTN